MVFFSIFFSQIFDNKRYFLYDTFIKNPKEKTVNRIVATQSAPKYCKACAKPESEEVHLRVCSACKGVLDSAYYCGIVCQRSNWKSHKEICQTYQKHGEEFKECYETVMSISNSIGPHVAVDVFLYFRKRSNSFKFLTAFENLTPDQQGKQLNECMVAVAEEAIALFQERSKD